MQHANTSRQSFVSNVVVVVAVVAVAAVVRNAINRLRPI